MKERTWMKKLAFLLVTLLMTAILAGCPLFTDETKEEKIKRILRDLEAEQIVPTDIAEVRTLLADKGITDFTMEEEQSWLFWDERTNTVDIVKAEELKQPKSRRKFSEGFELMLVDGTGSRWYPLIDFGDLASRLASARLTEGSYDSLSSALGYGENDLPYFFCEQLLKRSVIFNGQYYVGGESSLSVFDSAEEARAFVQENAVESALLCSEQPAPFSGFDTLTKVYVAASVERLGAGAFADCTALEEVILPKGLISIGAAAFSNCSSLEAIDLKGVTSLGESAFFASGLLQVVLTDGIEQIPAYAFAYCQNLRHVEWKSVDAIGEGAFYLCLGLETAEGPEVGSVGKEAFFLCETLKDVTFVGSQTAVGEDAFYGTAFVGRE